MNSCNLLKKSFNKLSKLHCDILLKKVQGSGKQKSRTVLSFGAVFKKILVHIPLEGILKTEGKENYIPTTNP